MLRIDKAVSKNNSAKKRAAKKLKRAKRNKTNSGVQLVDASSDLKDIFEIKMSEVILEFCREFLEKSERTDEVENIISIAVLAWNFSFYTIDERQKALLVGIEKLKSEGRQEESNDFLDNMDYFIERKRLYYSHIKRPIVSYEIRHVNKRVFLNVTSTVNLH